MSRPTFGNFEASGSVEYVYNGEPSLEENMLTPEFSYQELLSVQALGMRIHENARTRLTNTAMRTYGFSSVENIATNQYETFDGTKEVYMSFRTKKEEHDRWKMRLRFRQNELTQESARTLSEDDYLFDWIRNGNRMGFYVNRHVESTGKGKVRHTLNEVRPINSDDIEALKARMILRDSIAKLALDIRD